MKKIQIFSFEKYNAIYSKYSQKYIFPLHNICEKFFIIELNLISIFNCITLILLFFS